MATELAMPDPPTIVRNDPNFAAFVAYNETARMTKTLIDVMRHHVETRPDKVFWRHHAKTSPAELTFAQFHARASAFASAYLDAGLSCGEVVLIFLPHHIDAAPAFFGAMLIGAVPSFMPCPSAKQHPSIYWPAHIDLLQRIGPHVVLSDAFHVEQMHQHGLAALPRQIITVEQIDPAPRQLPAITVDENAIALLQHSSGTTSLKKGVALTHGAILRQVAAYSARLGMTEPNNIVSWLPLYHDMGLIACVVTPLILGQTVTCLDPFQWLARPVSLFEAIEQYQGHFTWMPNFGFELMTRAVSQDYAGNLSGMKAFINCSEPCKPQTFVKFAKRFTGHGVGLRQLQVCYAMAETVFAVSQTPIGKRAVAIWLDRESLYTDGVAVDRALDAKATIIASTGAPLPGLDVRLRDDHGQDVPDRHVGEVTLTGAFLFDGYFHNPETTAERIIDGRYHTRDLGFMREGELYILGRKDDLVIINGRNLYAHEVETIIAGIAGLKPGRAVAFGVFDPEIGSETLVVVAERDPAHPPTDDQQLARAVREAVYDRTNIDVGAFRATDPGWLVKTSSGKISRDANKKKYLAERASPPAETEPTTPQDASTLQQLAGIIGRMFKFPPSNVHAGTVASDVPGWTSLAHAALMLQVENLLKVRFSDDEIFSFATVGDLAARVDQLRAEGSFDVADDRVVYRSDTTSIIRFDGTSDGPDLIVFAGLDQKLGPLDLLDFASVLGSTSARDVTKYYVTDLQAGWYILCFNELVAKLNELSPRPKILLGNSMGGYAVMRFAPSLLNVVGVFAFVPLIKPLSRIVRKSGVPLQSLRVDFASQIPYCLLFGEVEDEEDQTYLAARVTQPALQRILTLPNCGHNVVPYLHSVRLLEPVIDCVMRPRSMADEVQAIVGNVSPDPDVLASRVRFMERRRAAELRRQRRATPR